MLKVPLDAGHILAQHVASVTRRFWYVSSGTYGLRERGAVVRILWGRRCAPPPPQSKGDGYIQRAAPPAARAARPGPERPVSAANTSGRWSAANQSGEATSIDARASPTYAPSTLMGSVGITTVFTLPSCGDHPARSPPTTRSTRLVALRPGANPVTVATP